MGFKGGISTTEEMNGNLLHGNSKMSLRILPPFPVLFKGKCYGFEHVQDSGLGFPNRESGLPLQGVLTLG